MFIPNPGGSGFGKCARWIIITSHLYYDRGVSIIDDADFDLLCRDVADIYGELSAQMKWQLGGAKALRSSGMGVKVTQLGVAASERIAKELGHDPAPYVFRPQGGPHPEFGCLWSPIRG